jgi:hypothetical protein
MESLIRNDDDDMILIPSHFSPLFATLSSLQISALVTFFVIMNQLFQNLLVE